MSNYLSVCNLKMCSISYYPSKHERQFILRDSDMSFWIGTEAWDPLYLHLLYNCTLYLFNWCFTECKYKTFIKTTVGVL